MTISGTKEWSTSSVNVSSGCSNDCRYCYAKAQAIRFGRKTPATWAIEEINQAAVAKDYRKRDGRIMLPTTHDLTPGTLHAVTTVSTKLLAAGNELLIVSKPRLDLIMAFCKYLRANTNNPRDLVTFRFSIGTWRDSILGFWEPGAPPFAQRLAALAWCHGDGWQTSVSCEPMLDRPENMIELVKMLESIVTDTIWLGKLNQAKARCAINGNRGEIFEHELSRLLSYQTDEEIKRLFVNATAQCDETKLRWKESIKKVVGIDLAKEAGTDV